MRTCDFCGETSNQVTDYDDDLELCKECAELAEEHGLEDWSDYYDFING
jgi:hypothetical protein